MSNKQNLKINFFSSSRYKFSRKELRPFIVNELKKRGVLNGVLNIAVVGKTKMKKISQEYKNEDVALPVLAFPYFSYTDKDEYLIGEIVICYPQAVLLAAERDKPVKKILEFLLSHAIDKIMLGLKKA